MIEDHSARVMIYIKSLYELSEAEASIEEFLQAFASSTHNVQGLAFHRELITPFPLQAYRRVKFFL